MTADIPCAQLSAGLVASFCIRVDSEKTFGQASNVRTEGDAVVKRKAAGALIAEADHAFGDLMLDRRVSLANRALTWADATVDAKQLAK